MAGRHKKILAQLKRMEQEKEKDALLKMDASQRQEYWAKQRLSQIDPREIEPLVIGDVTFRYDNGDRITDVRYPYGRHYPDETYIAEEFADAIKYKTERDAALKIFFKGGTLEELGLRRKPGIPARTMMQSLVKLLNDFTPSHERKMKTVAWFLYHTCDRITETVETV